MNIDLLSKIIKELILDTDRLSIPNLGVFIADEVPASFSDKGYTINPPYRRLVFRMKLEDDKTLVDFYSKSNEIEFGVADKIINDFTKELKVILEEKKFVIFPGLGKLRATKENNFFFVADEDLDIYPDGLGLESISLKTHEETKEEIADVVKMLDDSLNTDVTTSAATPVADVPDSVKAYKSKLRKNIIMIFIIIVGLILILLGGFIIINQINPDFIDSLLFNSTELELLNK